MEDMLQAPHRHIPANTEKERFVLKLFDNLWERYRRRVSYARTYEKVIQEHGARFVNDHIAFRTIALQESGTGIFNHSRIFRALGYTPQACYEFADKHLSSVHLAHPNAQFPKLFISELKSWELSDQSRRIIRNTLNSRQAAISDDFLAKLHRMPESRGGLLKTLIRFFNTLPWDLPRKTDVIDLDKESQFGAWVLLNGHDVNHFTASVNSHGVRSLDDIEKTVEALKKAGVPMKKEIEGARGSILRQSSTESVALPFRVRGKKKIEELAWSYAYFEIAERGFTVNSKTGAQDRFEGFLGAQATHLFEMTRVRKD